MTRERETCCVVEDGCEAPANGYVGTRARCFACGLAVCKVCSSIIKWYNWGRRRVCRNCQKEML